MTEIIFIFGCYEITVRINSVILVEMRPCDSIVCKKPFAAYFANYWNSSQKCILNTNDFYVLSGILCIAKTQPTVYFWITYER